MNADKEEFVIFYAWQSDRPRRRNLDFIEKATHAAAKLLNEDDECPYCIRIDRDTQGTPGLCDIPSTILDKIKNADGFLCDLTFVATSVAEENADDETDDDDDFQPRHCSNPNVLFELGVAFNSIGWERLICVMNEAYGEASNQIFDLAHRRWPIRYRLPDKGSTRRDAKEKLKNDLVGAIRAMLPLGRRGDSADATRAPTIRTSFEETVRNGKFHRMRRRFGALAIAVIPKRDARLSHDSLAGVHLPPPVGGSWNIEVRANAVISVGSREVRDRDLDPPRKVMVVTGAAEMRQDGSILGADVWMFDPTFHPGATGDNGSESLLVPAELFELRTVKAVLAYLEILASLNVPPPIAVCVSLLEVEGYEMYHGPGQDPGRVLDVKDISPEPVELLKYPGFNLRSVGTLLKPVFDVVSREFNFLCSFGFTEGGEFNRR